MLDFDFDGPTSNSNEAAVLKQARKTDAELQALVVPDDTPELERCALFLKNGQKVQKESVIINLSRTLNTFRAEAIERLIPVLTVWRASARRGGRARASIAATCARAAALGVRSGRAHVLAHFVRVASRSVVRA